MKNKLTLLISIALLPFLLSCEKENKRIDDFLVEFASVILADSNIAFMLDNGKVLKPKDTSSLDLTDGNRVILNYTPLGVDYVIVNSVHKIFLGVIQEEGYPFKVMTSPIKIISIWVSGHYLNMSIEVDYHSKSHVTGLYRDPNATKPSLYFSYSREDDPPGAPTLNNLSFDLSSLEKKTPFTVYVNSYTGLREFVFQID